MNGSYQFIRRGDSSNMANPQKENGYTAIANEILEKLCSYRISGEEHLILFSVFRKTYGFNKREDRISLSQFTEMTGLKKPTAQRAINKLVSKKIIIIKKDNDGNIYRFNKDFDQWIPLSKKITVIKKDNKRVIKNDNKGESKKRHTKDILNTNTKDIVVGEKNSPTEREFNFEEELQLLKEGGSTGNRKDFKIIALYWKKKQWTFENRDQYTEAFRRELKPAKALKGYTGEQIAQAIAHCQKKYQEWSLETVHKRITDLINKNYDG